MKRPLWIRQNMSDAEFGPADGQCKADRSMPRSGADLAKYAQQAHPPTLLMATAHITGDWSLLRPEWRPNLVLGGRDGSYSDEVAREIRALCCERLLEVTRREQHAPARPDYDTLSHFAAWLMGRNMDACVRMYKNQLLFEGEDPGEPNWSKSRIAADRPFQVVIIGAGLSGLLIGHRLKQAGVPFRIIEKSSGAGGVWHSNGYPGSRVDLNSFVYSFSFFQKIWKSYYATQDEILGYANYFSEKCGISDFIDFNVEVTSCEWDSRRNVWIVKTDQGYEPIEANVLISAVGQLSVPKVPDFPGRKDFLGSQFHSAQWDHGIDLAGKRVGIVGNAASAMQFVPKVAQQAEHVTLFMRTPNWLLPQPLLHEELGEAERWLMQHLPYYAGWYRAFEFIPGSTGLLEATIVDPGFPPSETAISAENAAIREGMLAYLEQQIVDRPDLIPFVIPDYPVFAKRAVADNGTWIRTLKRENVTTVGSPIRSLHSHALQTADGSEYPLDIIIYGTGFRANEFLMPIDFTGRDGTGLHEKWAGEARAYLGMTVPDFPNFFLMYGPNTNLSAHLASAINFFEGQASYIVDAVRHLLTSGKASVEVRTEIFDGYNQRLDQTNELRAYQWSSVSTWYKGPSGRSAQNYPFTAQEFAQRMASIDPTDFIFR